MTGLLGRYLAFIDGQNKLKLNRQFIILIILFGLLIVYANLTFIIKPQLKGIASVSQKITKIKKDLGNLAKDLSLMEDSKKGLIEDKSQKTAAKFKKIISEDGLPVLLKEVAGLANKNKVKIMQISRVSEEKVKEELIAGAKFLPIIITLNLSCNYHSLGSFINDLENMETFMSVDEMEISRDPKDYLQQKAEIVLKSYAKK